MHVNDNLGSRSDFFQLCIEINIYIEANLHEWQHACSTELPFYH